MTEECYAGVNAKASYRALQVEMGYDEGRRVSSGVKRISPTTRARLRRRRGLRAPGAQARRRHKALNLSLGNTKDLSDGKLQAVDIDISNQDGWDAYQQFLAPASCPKTGAPGHVQPDAGGRRSVYSDTTTIQAKLGGIQFGGQRQLLRRAA